MGLNILVVDDSAVMRKMIIKTIGLCGIDIDTIYQAADGIIGLEILQYEWVDLLFIDVNMPVTDGIKMLDRVRENPETRDTPVLVVSTESNEGRIKSIYQKRAGFVHKPFTPEILKDKILDATGILSK